MSPIKGKFLQEQAENAPTAGFAPVNYGKLSVTPMVKTFGKGDAKHNAPTKAPYKEGQKLEPNQVLELNIIVNISELNPSLQFEYERDVNMQRSGRIKTDWSEIVLPSIVAVFGEDWGDAILKGPYVEVEDVENVNLTVSKGSGRVLGVPKFLRVFKNKAECVAARNARFGNGDASSASASGVAEGIPDAAVQQVKSLMRSVGNEDMVREMLAAHPFGPYEPDDLLAAAAA